ncbi:hypothetical protein BB560_000360 [Smittium megazygosporum]|uniref:CBS domain-containing protein n=1 Tax=Smittium megazygosporum TaxID=133381 RepID=A0A2T9ZKN9_9FUNG|nr:hypothetical protein BB560_000360 [Smittium megazygosporum]
MLSKLLLKNQQNLSTFSIGKHVNLLEASEIMAAKRIDSLLVVDEHENLNGIFTSNDIAFKLVALGKEAHLTPAIDIATADPITIGMDESNMQALEIMISYRIRHLPVSNFEGNVIGMLDIMSCMNEEFDNISKSSLSAFLLYKNQSNSISPESIHVPLGYYDNEQVKRILYPNVGSVVGLKPTVYVSPDTNIMVAAQKMQETKTTAALVLQADKLVGILTTKDIVMRVVAADRNPNETLVFEAMTPHPDTISYENTCIQALEQMQRKKYLNIPVVDRFGEVYGVVGVLDLCIAVIETFKEHKLALNMLETTSVENLDTLIQNQIETAADHNSYPNMNNPETASLSSELSKAHSNKHQNPSFQNFPAAKGNKKEFYSLDSMSNSSKMSKYTYRQNEVFSNTSTNPVDDMRRYEVRSDLKRSSILGSSINSVIMDGKIKYKFKAPNGNIYRFKTETPDLKTLSSLVFNSLTESGLSNPGEVLEVFDIMYLDSEDDYIQIKNDDDLELAIKQTIHAERTFISIKLSERSVTGKSLEHSINAPESSESILPSLEDAPNAYSPKSSNINTQLFSNSTFIKAIFGVSFAVLISAIFIRYRANN